MQEQTKATVDTWQSEQVPSHQRRILFSVIGTGPYVLRGERCASADEAGLAYQLTIFKLSIFKLLTAASLVTRVMQRASAWAATMMSNARAFRLRRLATVRIRA